MPLERQIDLHFPKLGLDLEGPRNQWPRVKFGEKYEYFTHDAANVRSYSAADASRFRGGSRCGVSKLASDQVAGAYYVVQELNYVVMSDSGLALGLVAYYKLESNLLDTTSHNNHLTRASATTYGAGLIGSELRTGSGFRKPLTGLVKEGLTISAWLFATTATGSGGGTGFGQGAEVGDGLRLAYRSNGLAGKVVLRNRTGSDLIATGFTIALGTRIHAVVTYNSATVTLTVNGVVVGSTAYTIANAWHRLTFGIDTAGDDFTSPVDEVGVWKRPLKLAEIILLYAAGVGRRPFKATSGGTVQLSTSGRVVTLAAVSMGTIFTRNPGSDPSVAWNEPTNNTGETPALNISGVMDSTPANQKLYFADGINYVYYDPDTDAVELWAASAGAMPVDSDNHTGRILATWRDRVLVAGVFGDPQVLFASAMRNPTDFDYSPAVPSPTQAWSLNTGDLGRIGDSITGLCPLTDDVLLIFCDHSVFRMTGDPASGGERDLVTDKVGCAFGRAWCKGPDGTVYWVSNGGGFYALSPGGKPERISTKIDSLLTGLDLGKNIFRLAYDDRRQEVRVFITWMDEQQATTHYTIELRPQAWWPDTFVDTAMNPLCVCEFDGDEPGDRKILLGGWDGYVRKVDYDAATDDGKPIQSEVTLGPLLTSNTDEVKLVSLQGVFGLGSDDVDYDVLPGRTAEEALAADGVVPGVFSESRGYNQVINRSAHAIYVRLRSAGRWAMESIRAGLSSVLSPVRRRNG